VNRKIILAHNVAPLTKINFEKQYFRDALGYRVKNKYVIIRRTDG
jgi:hypothetical protein